jgi:aconitate hydratase
VKTVLAPGSPTADALLERAGLKADLESLGFAIAGYGCTVCIGNSGPLTPPVEEALAKGAINPVAVLSGNRNFPGRVHREVGDAFLASPPLVVLYALLGDAAIPLDGAEIGGVALAELWPKGEEVDALLAAALDPEDYARAFRAADANPVWADLAAPDSPLHEWDPESTYLRRPPFVSGAASSRLGDYSAVPLLVLGDDITTDHISPAGAIPADSEAGRWLVERGADPRDLNVYASRRGNWEVMLRGLFTAPAVRNLLAPGIPPGAILHDATGEVLPLWQAARLYADEGESVVILAGERYGMGSSRDWAAKGAALLGVRAVLASSFERIHRSNLVNMGVLPLRLPPEIKPQHLGLGIRDRIEIEAAEVMPHSSVPVRIRRRGGSMQAFEALAEVETALEARVLRAGGILPMILAEKLG